ncbi:MAG: hypothetical protein ACREBS_04210 [Nitrososphaerales archaeon]
MKRKEALLQDILKTEIVTLACDDPKIKPEMMWGVVSGCIALGLQVYYIDYDLQFSSLVQNLPDEEFNKLKDLTILQPRDEALADSVITLASESMRTGGLIILDSINTIQNLLSIHPSSSDLKVANHRSAILINAYQQLARFYSKSIIILNVTRSRPRPNQGNSISWERKVVGGRMTRFKSDAILFAREFPSHSESTTRGIRITAESASGTEFGGKLHDEYEL